MIMALWGNVGGGTTQSRLTGGSLAQATTNYAPVSGLNGDDPSIRTYGALTNISHPQFRGIMTNRSRTTIQGITDGASNTLLIGEGLGGHPRGDGANFFRWSWYGIGIVGTNFGLADPGRELPSGGDNFWRRFSSMHTGGVNFVWGDGSVRFVRYGSTATIGSPDWLVLAQMAGMADGAVYNLNQLSN
jgi:prepilin-type processing-associated H-X9-DG protein